MRTCGRRRILTREAFLNAIRRQRRDRRLEQRPAAHRRHGPPRRGRDRPGGLDGARLRPAAAGQHAAGRKISQRALPPRRRRAGGDVGIAPGRSSSTATRSPCTGRTLAENLAGRAGHRPRGHPTLRRPLQGARRLPGPARQSVRLRDHEDQRHLRRVPRAATSPRPGARRGVRSPRDRVRRIGRLPPPDQRSRRSRSTRIASSSSAAPGRSAGRARRKWSTCSRPTALLQRGITSLPTLGDGRQSGTSDSPSILNASPGKRRRRRAVVAAHRRHDPHRPQRRHLRRAGRRGRDRATPRPEPPPRSPPAQTPWEELYREKTGQLVGRRSAGDSRSSIAALRPRRRGTTIDCRPSEGWDPRG